MKSQQEKNIISGFDTGKDVLRVENLRVRTILGVFPEERERERDVVISFEMETDCSKAGVSDALEDAVDWAAAAEKVRKLVANSAFNLAEALAQAIADLLLSDCRVKRVRVSVDKPAAMPDVDSVGVSIIRPLEA